MKVLLCTLLTLTACSKKPTSIISTSNEVKKIEMPAATPLSTPFSDKWGKHNELKKSIEVKKK